MLLSLRVSGLFVARETQCPHTIGCKECIQKSSAGFYTLHARVFKIFRFALLSSTTESESKKLFRTVSGQLLLELLQGSRPSKPASYRARKGPLGSGPPIPRRCGP